MHITFESFNEPMGYEALTIAAAVQSPTAAKIFVPNTNKRAAKALVTAGGPAVSTDGIRFTVDGTAPVSATTGHFLPAGQSMWIEGPGNITKLKMIREGSNSVIVSLTYFN